MRERLTFSERQLARRIARQALIDCGGNGEVAKSLAHERCEDAGVSPLVILAVVKLIIALIEFWIAYGVTEPSEDPMPGEPAPPLLEVER